MPIQCPFLLYVCCTDGLFIVFKISICHITLKPDEGFWVLDCVFCTRLNHFAVLAALTTTSIPTMRSANCFPMMCCSTYAFLFFVFVVSIGSGLSFLPRFFEPVQCLIGECCSDALHFNHECKSELTHLLKIFMEIWLQNFTANTLLLKGCTIMWRWACLITFPCFVVGFFDEFILFANGRGAFVLKKMAVGFFPCFRLTWRIQVPAEVWFSHFMDLRVLVKTTQHQFWHRICSKQEWRASFIVTSMRPLIFFSKTRLNSTRFTLPLIYPKFVLSWNLPNCWDYPSPLSSVNSLGQSIGGYSGGS